MREGQPKAIYLKDYRPPFYFIRTAYLNFRLDEEYTYVTANYYIERNSQVEGEHPLILQGEQLELISLSLDGKELDQEEFTVSDSALSIGNVPGLMSLSITVRIQPQLNTYLEGLYKSSGNFCTQCEAEGFRKIIYFADRPDVLTVYTVRIEAQKQRYPVLLSNGNRQEIGDLADGWHYAVWHDPYPKPCYLFALVAGNLSCRDAIFTTASGRKVLLQLFVEEHNVNRCDHALASLQKAMRWDEVTFGLEYDLDVYMIVAVDDFNMGAMENKGLNIFNSKCVLASPETATDDDYKTIEGVIAHEYFHNWTGNRVTCRDWFQLSLKEGLTVYRDQEFTADMTSRAVQRIQDVRLLRAHQFAEDASPMAHPVRPDSFIEINNFYTMTVYEKGAEIVRMYETLLGKEGFRKGMDLYFKRHDGQAVTVEDFANAMAAANHFELRNFMRWYTQAGTPEINVTDEWNEKTGEYTLVFQQGYPSIHGLADRQAVLIPIKVGMLDSSGESLPVREISCSQNAESSLVLQLVEERQSFIFAGFKNRPIPSLLQGFSAPVQLRYDYSNEQLALLMAYDQDEFNRWEACQRLATRCLLDAIGRIQKGEPPAFYDHLVKSYRTIFHSPGQDPALLAEMLSLPDENYLAEMLVSIDVDAIFKAREQVKQQLATELQEELREAYTQNCLQGAYRYHAVDMGRRSLSAACLSLLAMQPSRESINRIVEQYHAANNMTDKINALGVLNNMVCEERELLFADFERTWMNDALVLDKWFSLQARARLPSASDRIRRLLSHTKFSLKNPNRVRSVLGAFIMGNPTGFHAMDGSGYDLLAEQIITLDRINPQVAARLAKGLIHWRRFDERRQELQTTQLHRIQNKPHLSSDLYELVSRALAE